MAYNSSFVGSLSASVFDIFQYVQHHLSSINPDRFFIDFDMGFGINFDIFLAPFPFTPSTCKHSKHIVFTMFSNIFTFLENIVFYDVHDLLLYLFQY